MYKPHVSQSYCFNNDILIYPVPVNKSTYKIEINYKGQVKASSGTYNKVKMNDKIWEMYEYFYDKR